jgi:predicted ATPase/class 3 adenylate cyclase
MSGLPHLSATAAPEELPTTPWPASGTVTFLLTDIEGSTRIWERDPDGARTALARHDALIEGLVARNRGRVIRPRGEGDSRFAVFERPSDAVSAACAIQRAFVDEPWRTPEPLRVRIAVHTGEAELREQDYYGRTPNRCARLREIGYGGQTLLSEVTALLVRDCLPQGVELRDLGLHRLRDLEHPERIFEAALLDTPTELRPLASLDTRRHNLPAPVSPLVGRELEIAEVARLLERTRLLTLTGAGGVGKTRLALRVAMELLERFPDGAWLVELAPPADPQLVPQSVARVLSVRERPGRPLTETLAEQLCSRRLLLVLDNCEHVIQACAALAQTLLRACPDLTILATSRESLGIGGEVAWRVPSLAVPDLRDASDLELVARLPAVRLFVERAAAVCADFILTDQNARAVADVCRRLDGLPLAIELAAARVRALGPEEIAARLHDRFRLLGEGRRLAPTHQRTLRATLDWSYQLLTPLERRLFGRLAVFAGGWTAEAAEMVAGGDGLPANDVLDVLAGVVDKSLVLADRCTDGTTRYRLLETVRAYASEQLTASDEAATVRRRHAEHYLALAKAAEPDLNGPTPSGALARLAGEHDNLRAVLGWALASGEAGVGLQLASCTCRLWQRHGHVSEGIEWLEELLKRDGAAEPILRADALVAVGELACALGDIPQARERCLQSLQLCEKLGYLRGKARSLHILGWCLASSAQSQQDYRQASGYQEECLVLWRRLGEQGRDARARAECQLGEAKALHELGEVARYRARYLREHKPALPLREQALRDEYQTAETRQQEALELRRELGDVEGVGWSCHCRAWTAFDQGQYDRAMGWTDAALGSWRELGHETGTAASRSLRARIMWRVGDGVGAAQELRESLRLWPELHHREWLRFDLQALAGLAVSRQPEQEGARYAALLLGAAEALRDTPLPLHQQDEPAEISAYVREHVDEDMWNSARAEGRAMRVDDAWRYAMQLTKQLCVAMKGGPRSPDTGAPPQVATLNR